MSIFRRNRPTLDPEIEALVTNDCVELMSHVGRAMTLYSQSIEQDLIEARTSLRQALSELEDQRICLDSMKDSWPNGQPVFDQIKRGMDAQYGLITNADEWISLIHSPNFDIQGAGDSRKYREHVSKNRKLAAEAAKSFEKASVILKETAGLELPVPDV